MLLNPWTPFDASMYLSIAQHGYTAHTSTFFPLFSFLLRLVGPSLSTMSAFGIALNTIVFLASLVVLRRISMRQFGATISGRAVWILALFPTAFVFSSVYSDSLFLFLLLAMYYAWYHEHLATAAIFGLLTGLTRNTGAAVSLAFLVLTWSARGDAKLFQRCAVALTPLIALLTFEIFLGLSLHNAFVGVTTHELFGRQLSAPWQPVLGDLGSLFTSSVAGVALPNLAFFLVVS